MSAKHLKSASKGMASDYSTFIQQLQNATDKLMNEVFELSSTAPMPSPIRKPQSKIITEPSFKHYKIDNLPKTSDKLWRRASTDLDRSQTFRNFIARTNYYQKQKQDKRADLNMSYEQVRAQQHTFKPDLSKSRYKNLDVKPIKDRCLEIQQSKQKKLFQLRAEKKMRQENELNKITFQPKINTKAKPKTFQDYYDEKVKWEKNKLEQREKRKQLNEVKKHSQCLFKPSLQTQKSTFYKNNEKSNKNTKVEDRLLQRLELSIEKKQKK